MVKKYSKTDGTVTVSGNDGKIITNLPSNETLKQAKTKADALTAELSNTTDSNEMSYAEKQKKHTEELMRSIEANVDIMIESGQIDQFVAHMQKFHNYSLNNQMLIWIQNPEATQVAGYNRWEETGRQVRKGEKGLEILAPITFKVKEPHPITGEEVEKTYMKGFRSVRVFDISQTDPAEYIFANETERNTFINEWESKGYTAAINPNNPLSVTITETPQSPAKLLEGEAPKEMITFVEQEFEKAGITPSTNHDTVLGEANGASWKDPHTGEIKVAVKSTLDEAQKYKTLVHELMHIKLGHLDRMDEYHSANGGHRGEMEVAVEALSYMVGNRFGLDTSNYSTGYMAGWARQNKNKLKEVLEKDVLPFYKEITDSLPSIEKALPPMGTQASRKHAAKKSTKRKTKWRKK